MSSETMENIHVLKVKEEERGLISNTIKIEPGFHMTFEDGIKEEPVSNEDTKFKVEDLLQEALDHKRKIRRKFCSPSLCLRWIDQPFNCNCPTRPWPRPNHSWTHFTNKSFEAVPISPFKLRIRKCHNPHLK